MDDIECLLVRDDASVWMSVRGVTLPPARVMRDSPGLAYVPLLGVAHGHYLSWSPKLLALTGPIQGVSGRPEETHLEDLIDAVTLGLVSGDPTALTEQLIIDPDVIGFVTGVAARSVDAPRDEQGWERCLGQSIQLLDTVLNSERSRLLVRSSAAGLTVQPGD